MSIHAVGRAMGALRGRNGRDGPQEGISSDPTTPRRRGFYESSSFQRISDWADYVLDNPELRQGLDGQPYTALNQLRKSGNPRVSQFALAFRNFLEDSEKVTFKKDPKRFKELVAQVLDVSS